MKFLIGKTLKEACAIAEHELLWQRILHDTFLDLNREEVRVISQAKALRCVRPTCVYLLPGFDCMNNTEWHKFVEHFASRNIKTMRIGQ